MVEPGGIFSQEERDRSLGLPEEMQGTLSLAAQVLRYEGLMEQGASKEDAMRTFGLSEEDIETAAIEAELAKKGEQ